MNNKSMSSNVWAVGKPAAWPLKRFCRSFTFEIRDMWSVSEDCISVTFNFGRLVIRVIHWPKYVSGMAFREGTGDRSKSDKGCQDRMQRTTGRLQYTDNAVRRNLQYAESGHARQMPYCLCFCWPEWSEAFLRNLWWIWLNSAKFWLSDGQKQALTYF